ncbi:MAG: KpsF/GutQ family sugar-phosphate isomerase [Saprospiraceae bacterium]|nr:MAG: KpsF/GutQ family protein [Bacteroidetes bacterium OLB9]MCO6463133.1 KpsF/GutQ family sugar-phosphate isomerase [Saprospiraceae bacterium]
MQKEIQENIQETLQKEADALMNMVSSVDSGISEVIQLLFNCQGRLVITGIGKSAIIAHKIVATLNSTGTSALFMHAADAIHGDLGMISKEDIVICISKSGDTPEIKVLAPLIKGFGNTLIAMVSNKTSFLARNADYIIHLPLEAEADPNNLAPTTSTTLQIAMGDAIAIALLSMRGFSQENFAKYHPGGSLGKQLYLRAGDLAAENERPKVYLGDNLRTIIMEISSKRLGATAVMDDNENLVGIITDGDLRRMLESGQDTTQITAGNIMTSMPKSVEYNTLAVEALTLMRKYSITQLPVMDGCRYKGIVHLHDLVREGII